MSDAVCVFVCALARARVCVCVCVFQSVCLRVKLVLEPYKPQWCRDHEDWALYLFSPCNRSGHTHTHTHREIDAHTHTHIHAPHTFICVFCVSYINVIFQYQLHAIYIIIYKIIILLWTAPDWTRLDWTRLDQTGLI